MGSKQRGDSSERSLRRKGGTATPFFVTADDKRLTGRQILRLSRRLAPRRTNRRGQDSDPCRMPTEDLKVVRCGGKILADRMRRCPPPPGCFSEVFTNTGLIFSRVRKVWKECEGRNENKGVTRLRIARFCKVSEVAANMGLRRILGREREWSDAVRLTEGVSLTTGL